MSDSNKLVLTAIIGILVGLVLGRLLWYSRTGLPDTDTSYTQATTTDNISEQETPTSSQEETNISNPSSSSVSAENQSAGDSAKISVMASEAVWVEVRDNNNGVMGNVLGAKHVDAGRTMVTVGLQRGTVKGRSYFVAIAPYNKGVINYAVSALLKDASGKAISATFTAQ